MGTEKLNMLATIDIGSNSTLLLIGDLKADGKVGVVADEARINRLGEGLSKYDLLYSKAIDRTIDILKEYREICKKHGVNKVIAVGTAALRTAKNADEFVSKIKEELNLEIEIISPEKEAWFTYLACEKDFGSEILVCDIGGGSTELIWRGRQQDGKKTQDCQMLSIPVGAVNLTERVISSDPISIEEFQELCSVVDQHLNRSLSSLPRRHCEIMVATAGTATTLAAIYKKLEHFDPSKVHACTLEMLDIQVIMDILKMNDIAKRRKIPGLQKGREDVILAGSVLLDRTMRKLGYDIVTISDRGLRWGVFYQFYSNKGQNNAKQTI